jgi:hypothetical protein
VAETTKKMEFVTFYSPGRLASNGILNPRKSSSHPGIFVTSGWGQIVKLACEIEVAVLCSFRQVPEELEDRLRK